MPADLSRTLFSPSAVALIGASDNPTKVAGRPLAFMRTHGFSGEIWPVNPRRESIQGLKAYPDLGALPGIPDIAFVLLDTDAATAAVKDCVEHAIPAVCLLADGFEEGGQDGRQLQQRLREMLQAGQTRLVGPQSIGLVDTRTGLTLTANGAFAEPQLATGSTMLLSHSGSMIGALLSRAQARGMGWARMVSVGNELDVSMAQIGLSCIDDPSIDSFALFLETIRDRNRFIEFTKAAAKADKPVCALRLGRSAIGRELAQSHTGALLGDGAGLDAFLEDCGVCLVDSLTALIEAPGYLKARPKPFTGGGVAIVTTTGGGGALAVEALSRRGVKLYTPCAKTQTALAAAGLPPMNGPLLDVTLAGTRPDVMTRALEIAGNAAGGDAPDIVAAVIGSSARFQPELAARPLADARISAGLVAQLMPEAPETARLLRDNGLPVFSDPETMSDILEGDFKRRQRWPGPCSVYENPEIREIDDSVALSLAGEVGLILPAYGIQSAQETELPAAVRYPVAVKGIAPGVAHRTDVGLVQLGVSDARTFSAARTAMAGRGCESILVMEMVEGLAELLIGFRHDPVVGPIIIVSPGGLLAERSGEKSVRTAPVDPAEARRMLSEISAMDLLAGYRNQPRGDLDAAAEAIANLSGLASMTDAVIVEAEVNPLIVRPEGQGAVAVDVLVRGP